MNMDTTIDSQITNNYNQILYIRNHIYQNISKQLEESMVIIMESNSSQVSTVSAMEWDEISKIQNNSTNIMPIFNPKKEMSSKQIVIDCDLYIENM